MPEYLAPGVYVEEVSFRPKSIEGVSTSVAGFIGPTRFGPVGGEPELLTSFADFERIFGGLDNIRFDDDTGQPQTPGSPNYVAHAARAFFDNGGSKLYVVRVYGEADPDNPREYANRAIGSPVQFTLRSRFPGLAGEMRIIFALRSLPMAIRRETIDPTIIHLSGARPWSVAYVRDRLTPTSFGGVAIAEGLYDLVPDGERFRLESADGTTVDLDDLDPGRHIVHRVVLTIRVRRPGQFEDEMIWDDVVAHPRGRDPLTAIFARNPESRLRQLTIPFWIDDGSTPTSGPRTTSGAALLRALVTPSSLYALSLGILTPREARDYVESLSPRQSLP